ncbi:hypothetical protein DJ018_05130 [Phenylobacterium deserti]|uniref:Uncharacterized protein n=1 Tax=Phenylobacterium deserti TaxID=1914756 RepID=A0A328AS00_9CAUL|nr:hypothetical protein DJ018_05130 [Phenylobacterium deserti]
MSPDGFRCSPDLHQLTWRFSHDPRRLGPRSPRPFAPRRLADPPPFRSRLRPRPGARRHRDPGNPRRPQHSAVAPGLSRLCTR